MKSWLIFGLVVGAFVVRAAGGIADKPFSQDVSVKFRLHPALTNAVMKKLCLDKDGVAYVLSDRGVARLFGDTLRAKYRAAVADHWELEKVERFPTFNFVTAGCGLKDFDPDGAVWTLRGYPLDTISWSVANSHRKDVTKLPPNFRGQEMVDLLPPGERLMARCNTQPLILDAGDGGHTEFPGDEYVLGYWLGRYVGAIAAPGGR